jgi:hypothetical protein
VLKKSITFESHDGKEVTEEHYFHLSKADLVELEMTHKGGLQAYIQRVVESQDGRAIIEEFKRLILMSYGKKNQDGTRFIKNQELRDDFISSPAYDVLFMELVTDAGLAAEFVNGIIPKGLGDQVEKTVPKPKRTLNDVIEAERIKEGADEKPAENVFENNVPIPDTPPADPVFQQKDARLLTPKEVREMDATELQQGLATGAFRLG